ncbi:MAG TPA: thiol oxidoreductase, partial [Desulfobacterales bacterium]|nr:thiol oxidoreductase [Desulfobacterales bacterium]
MYTVNAYAQPSPNLSPANLDIFLEGDLNFETSFVGSINSNTHMAGLGPVQNHVNCDACHPRDGRASLPYVPHVNFDDTMFEDKNGFRKLRHSGVFLRISIENEQTRNAPKSADNYWGSPVPVPNFSDQLFHRASISGIRPIEDGFRAGQADVWIKYKTKTIRYPDGNTVELSRPYLFMDNPYDDPDDPMVFNDRAFSKDSKSALFQDDVKTGIRIGMPMIGLGLLSAINEADILALADPDDADGDGISGKPNWVYDQEKAKYCKPLNLCDQEQYKPVSLGRYGWKASTPTVAHQGLGAMRGDMGVTNPLFPMESIAGTDLMRAYKAKNPNFKTYCDNNKTDADEEISKSIVFYSETLAVPQRRDVNDAEVKRGGALFSAIGCV